MLLFDTTVALAFFQSTLPAQSQPSPHLAASFWGTLAGWCMQGNQGARGRDHDSHVTWQLLSLTRSGSLGRGWWKHRNIHMPSTYPPTHDCIGSRMITARRDYMQAFGFPQHSLYSSSPENPRAPNDLIANYVIDIGPPNHPPHPPLFTSNHNIQHKPRPRQ